jgi:hypothetical protein
VEVIIIMIIIIIIIVTIISINISSWGWGGVKLSPLGTLAAVWPILPAPDDK